MAGVYIIFQYVDSLVNRTSPIYFPCNCFDLVLIMRLFLHVPRLLKKKREDFCVHLNAEGKIFTAVASLRSVSASNAIVWVIKVKERSQKACDYAVKKPQILFFCEYLLLFHSNQGRDSKRNPSTQTFLSLESQAKTSRQLLWRWSIVWELFFNQGSMKTTKT